MDLFLDTKNKVWKIKDIEIPVIEDVPMKDLMWFRLKSKEAENLKNSDKTTVVDGLKFDEEWWEKTCQLGLGKTMEEVLDTGISEKDFRTLMAEVFNFLTVFCTIEEAKQSGLYEAETQKKDKKQ